MLRCPANIGRRTLASQPGVEGTYCECQAMRQNSHPFPLAGLVMVNLTLRPMPPDWAAAIRRPGLLLYALLASLCLLLARPAGIVSGQAAVAEHLVQPGDTWLALSLRYDIEQAALQAANPHPNPLRQPVIGDLITLPATAAPPDGQTTTGRIVRLDQGGLLRAAAEAGVSVSALARLNELIAPVTPSLLQPVLAPDEESPLREWPAHMDRLELSQVPAQPGQALAMRAIVAGADSFSVQLNDIPFNSFVSGDHAVSVGGTGAFFPAGAPELLIQAADGPAWIQPWRVVEGSWDYDRVTLTGDAAAIDQESINAERARLFELWSLAGLQPLWNAPFEMPIQNYLEVSSNYGARRSYNDGPFRTYHEGVDFSAYGGTPVSAPAGGIVVLAEQLYVRGGAVIIDHGLGIYSGFYHMSKVLVTAGQEVAAGAAIGEVGTTGLSSGNHLHWDLLVAGVWVSAAAWREQDTACWILAGWGAACPPVEE